jgi:hypothetical protein
MNHASPRMRRFAKHLIVSDALANRASEADRAAAFPVTDTLRPHLAMLMGNGGFRALLARALALATAEVSWLRAVHVTADGDLEGLAEMGSLLDPTEFLEGRVVLLAQLLGLLVAFIGPGLTSRMVGEFWPQIPFQDRDFGKEQENEEAK